MTEQRNAEMALRLSEERLELVIKGSSDGYWDASILPGAHWNSPQTQIWWSPRVREMLGYTEEEFPDVLESWTSRLHPEDRDRVFAALTAHIERRVLYDVEYRLLTKSGIYHWFRARGQAIWDAGGRMSRMSGSLQSIMDRKLAEDALRRRQQLLQEIADNTTAVIYVKDLDGRFLFVNRRFEEIFNLTTSQIIGRTNHEIFPREIADALRANDVQVVAQNTLMEYEEVVPHTDGFLHTYVSIKLPLRDQAGIPYATCGVSTDITERKRSEAALREQEERLRLALTSTHEGVWNWALQTDRIYWSPQVDHFLAIPSVPGPKSQAGLLALVEPEDREAMVRELREVMDPSRTTVTFAHRVKNPDGSLLWCVWSGHIIRDHAGKALHVLGTVRAAAAIGEVPPGQRTED